MFAFTACFVSAVLRPPLRRVPRHWSARHYLVDGGGTGSMSWSSRISILRPSFASAHATSFASKYSTLFASSSSPSSCRRSVGRCRGGRAGVVGSEVVGVEVFRCAVVGYAVGSEVVGELVGSEVVDETDGEAAGSEVVGLAVGLAVGEVVGEVVGLTAGEVVGLAVGLGVGAQVPPQQVDAHASPYSKSYPGTYLQHRAFSKTISQTDRGCWSAEPRLPHEGLEVGLAVGEVVGEAVGEIDGEAVVYRWGPRWLARWWGPRWQLRRGGRS